MLESRSAVDLTKFSGLRRFSPRSDVKRLDSIVERVIGRMIGCAREREERREGGARGDLRERTEFFNPSLWLDDSARGGPRGQTKTAGDGWARGVRREPGCGCIWRSQRLCKKRRRKCKNAKKCENGSKRWRSRTQPKDCWKPPPLSLGLKPTPAHYIGR